MNDLLAKILEQMLLIIVPMLVMAGLAWVIPTIRIKWAEAKAINPDLFYALEEAARIAVHAAEQSKLAGLIEDKLDYAIDIAELYLKAKGLNVDIHLIRAAIEKGVIEFFPHDDVTPTEMGFDK